MEKKHMYGKNRFETKISFFELWKLIRGTSLTGSWEAWGEALRLTNSFFSIADPTGRRDGQLTTQILFQPFYHSGGGGKRFCLSQQQPSQWQSVTTQLMRSHNTRDSQFLSMDFLLRKVPNSLFLLWKSIPLLFSWKCLWFYHSSLVPNYNSLLLQISPFLLEK